MTTKRLTRLRDEYDATIKAFDAYRKRVSDAAKEEHEEKKK